MMAFVSIDDFDKIEINWMRILMIESIKDNKPFHWRIKFLKEGHLMKCELMNRKFKILVLLYWRFKKRRKRKNKNYWTLWEDEERLHWIEKLKRDKEDSVIKERWIKIWKLFRKDQMSEDWLQKKREIQSSCINWLKKGNQSKEPDQRNLETKSKRLAITHWQKKLY